MDVFRDLSALRKIHIVAEEVHWLWHSASFWRAVAAHPTLVVVEIDSWTDLGIYTPDPGLREVTLANAARKTQLVLTTTLRTRSTSLGSCRC